MGSLCCFVSLGFLLSGNAYEWPTWKIILLHIAEDGTRNAIVIVYVNKTAEIVFQNLTFSKLCVVLRSRAYYGVCTVRSFYGGPQNRTAFRT